MRYVVGVDEAGRGPLAGPVAVGAVLVEKTFDWRRIEGARDSKQMRPSARARMYERILKLQDEGALRVAVSFSSAQTIDRKGIVPAIRSALARTLVKLAAHPDECAVLLDGSLKAPPQYREQATIIRGDDLEPVISLASIVAKVRRDRLMERLSATYPAYRFHEHKGYGTRAHRELISTEGMCGLHRITFCTRIPGALPEGSAEETLQEGKISV